MNPNSASQQNQARRSMSVSEGPYVRSEPLIPTSTSQISLNQSPSESNWANKYDDFEIGKAIGKYKYKII
jgi:hypothetical protein